MSQLNVELQVQREGRYPENGPSYQTVTECRVTAPNQNAVSQAVERLSAAMTAGARQQVENWLIALQAATAGGRPSGVASITAFELYTAALLDYPADIARYACLTLARRKPARGTPIWFPTLGELVAECDRLVAPRKAMLAGLQGWKPVSEEQGRAEVRREWLFLEAEARRESLNCRRSDPDRASELIEFADYAAARARSHGPRRL